MVVTVVYLQVVEPAAVKGIQYSRAERANSSVTPAAHQAANTAAPVTLESKYPTPRSNDGVGVHAGAAAEAGEALTVVLDQTLAAALAAPYTAESNPKYSVANHHY